MFIQSSEEYEKEGRRLLQDEQAARALEVFEEGSRRFPGDEDLSMGTAMACLRLGEFARACGVLEELRRERPRSSETLQALAEAYLARGMAAEAVRVAREAAEGGRGDARLLARLGRTFYSRRWYREALPFYEEAVQASPNWSEAWFGLGACRWVLRQGAAAAQALRRAVELEPTDWQARQFLGCVLCDGGLRAQARAMLESIPLDAPWQKPALERLIALAGWPADAERGRRLESLWHQVMGGGVPKSAMELLEEVSGTMEEASSP